MALKSDIVPRLVSAAASSDKMSKADLERLLAEAAEVIQTLRELVAIRDEIEAEAVSEALAERKAKGGTQH